MHKEKRHPSWWQLWLLLPALGALAYVEASASLSVTGHRIVEVGLVLVGYALVSVWLRANEAAWLREMQDQAAGHKVRILLEMPEEPAVIARNNGNRRQRSEWCVPTQPVEPDPLTVDRRSEVLDA